jgi:ComF family protein
VLKDIFSGLVDLVYPPLCISCKKRITPSARYPVLCNECLSTVKLNGPPNCPKCSRSLADDPTQALCRTCRKHPPAFDFAWCACIFTDPLRYLIHSFKFGDKTILRHLFIDLMIEHINRSNLDIAQFDHILPVPLSPVRKRERSYNQAELLAVGISRHFKIPLLCTAISRRNSGPAQSSLSEKERFTNIKGAFKMNSLLNIKNKNIIIIDDLLTTGATASEMALTLKKNGAATVGVFTLAVTL